MVYSQSVQTCLKKIQLNLLKCVQNFISKYKYCKKSFYFIFQHYVHKYEKEIIFRLISQSLFLLSVHSTFSWKKFAKKFKKRDQVVVDFCFFIIFANTRLFHHLKGQQRFTTHIKLCFAIGKDIQFYLLSLVVPAMMKLA